jgi:hypothetical protein
MSNDFYSFYYKSDTQKMSTLLRCGDRSYFNITLQRADNGHRVGEYLF